jgi:hypothetical protein
METKLYVKIKKKPKSPDAPNRWGMSPEQGIFLVG